MGVALQQMLVMHLRDKVTNPERLRSLRERVRKKISKGGHIPADDEIEEEIDNVLIGNHRKGVKDLVARAIAYVYWRCLKDYLQSEFRITQAKIGRALGISTSNLSRWGKETLPEASKTFLALVWRKIDVRAEQLKFPPHHENFRSFDAVIAEAIRLAVEQIRVREFGKKYAKLSIPMMECARLLYKHQDSDTLALRAPATLNRRRAVMLDVLQGLRRVFPHDRALNEEMVEQVASQWLLSYAFFDLGRPEWDFFREK